MSLLMIQIKILMPYFVSIGIAGECGIHWYGVSVTQKREATRDKAKVPMLYEYTMHDNIDGPKIKKIARMTLFPYLIYIKFSV